MPVALGEGALPAARTGGQAMAVSLVGPDNEQTATHGKQPKVTQRRREVLYAMVPDIGTECSGNCSQHVCGARAWAEHSTER